MPPGSMATPQEQGSGDALRDGKNELRRDLYAEMNLIHRRLSELSLKIDSIHSANLYIMESLKGLRNSVHQWHDDMLQFQNSRLPASLEENRNFREGFGHSEGEYRRFERRLNDIDCLTSQMCKFLTGQGFVPCSTQTPQPSQPPQPSQLPQPCQPTQSTQPAATAAAPPTPGAPPPSVHHSQEVAGPSGPVPVNYNMQFHQRNNRAFNNGNSGIRGNQRFQRKGNRNNFRPPYQTAEENITFTGNRAANDRTSDDGANDESFVNNVQQNPPPWPNYNSGSYNDNNHLQQPFSSPPVNDHQRNEFGGQEEAMNPHENLSFVQQPIWMPAHAVSAAPLQVPEQAYGPIQVYNTAPQQIPAQFLFGGIIPNNMPSPQGLYYEPEMNSSIPECCEPYEVNNVPEYNGDSSGLNVMAPPFNFNVQYRF